MLFGTLVYISFFCIFVTGQESCQGSTGYSGTCTFGVNCLWIYEQGLARENVCRYTNGKLVVCCPNHQLQRRTTTTTQPPRRFAALSDEDSCTVSTGVPGKCVPTNQCPWIREKGLERSNVCRYERNLLLLCCPRSQISGLVINRKTTPVPVVVYAQIATKYCAGSTGFDGSCIDTDRCPWIHANGLTRANQCGYTNGKLQVCCPQNKVSDVTTAKPVTTTEAPSIGSSCDGSTGYHGVCLFGEDCPWVYEEGLVRSNTCGYDGRKLMVCCPMNHATPPPDKIQSFSADMNPQEETCDGTKDGLGYCVLIEDCKGLPEEEREKTEFCDHLNGMVYKCCPDKYAYNKNIKLPLFERDMENVKVDTCDLKEGKKGYCIPLQDCNDNTNGDFCGANSAFVGVIRKCCRPERSFHKGKRLPPLKSALPTKPPLLVTKPPFAAKPSLTPEQVMRIHDAAPCSNTPDNTAGFCTLLEFCPDFPEVIDNTPHLCGYTNDHQPQFCCPKPENLPDPHKKEKLLVKKLKDDCGFGGIFRVSNGEDAALGDWPWIAALFYGETKTFRCGGSLISEKFVLTAGHCVDDKTPERVTEVRLGEWNILTERDCNNFGTCAPRPQVFTPKNIILHPKYQVIDNIAYNDIALIELSDYVELTEWVSYVCLDDGSVSRINKSAIVMGWGRTGKSRVSDILQMLQLPIVKNSECLRIWWTYNVTFTTREHMCAGGIPGKDSCKGDSGGPLIVPVRGNLAGRYFQIGVVSFGLERCGGRTTAPSVYADLQRYYFWIIHEISKVERLS